MQPWPRIGLGCASLGNPLIGDAEAEHVIARAIDRGIRFFDVAPLYGGGLAECRLGRALAESAMHRDEYVLCTKTGVTRPFGQGAIPPGGSRRREADVWDYSDRATRESVARSCERLGVERFDVVHLHDPDDHLDTCLDAWSTLDALRDEGTVNAIGIGSNAPAPIESLLDRARFDAFLLAGRYTLLDQTGAALLDRARNTGVRVVAGGVFNSGILGSWPPSSVTFDYVPAPDVLRERASRIATTCEKHRVPIGAAALHFVLRNPAVTTMLIGPTSIDELERSLEGIATDIPEALWNELQQCGLVAAAPHEELVHAN